MLKKNFFYIGSTATTDVIQLKLAKLVDLSPSLVSAFIKMGVLTILLTLLF